MKTITILFCLFSVFPAMASVLEKQPEYSRVYDPARNPFDDGRAALDLASKTNRRVMIEVGGNWCVFCEIFDRYLRENEDVAKAFFSTFVLLRVNVSDENNNREFLSNFTRVDGYPYIFITENNGKVVYANDMREMTIKGRPDREKMLNFLKRWKLADET